MKTKKTKKGYNKHHLRPRSSGGSSSDENLCFLKIKKHAALHRLFFNLTPEQIMKLLAHFEEDMKIVFGTINTKEALAIYLRLLQFKERRET